jgi:hypothetical protein
MLREQIMGPELFDQAFREYSTKWAFKQPQPADFFRTLEEGGGDQLNYFWRGWFFTTYANDQAVTAVEEQSADSLIGTTARGRNYVRITVENKGGITAADPDERHLRGWQHRVREDPGRRVAPERAQAPVRVLHRQGGDQGGGGPERGCSPT